MWIWSREPVKIKGYGSLYITNGGGHVKVADIKEAEIEEIKPEHGDILEKTVRMFSGNMEITVQLHLSRLEKLSILYGRKITNNYLKMHGGIMTRIGANKRKRRKH